MTDLMPAGVLIVSTSLAGMRPNRRNSVRPVEFSGIVSFSTWPACSAKCAWPTATWIVRERLRLSDTILVASLCSLV